MKVNKVSVSNSKMANTNMQHTQKTKKKGKASSAVCGPV